MPASGYQVGSTCYLTAGDAAVAASSAVTGSIALVAGSSAVLDVQSIDRSNVTYRVSPLDGSGVSSLTVPLNPLPCVLPGASEAVQLGWMIAGVWIVVYAISLLGRYVWSNVIEAQNNDT